MKRLAISYVLGLVVACGSPSNAPSAPSPQPIPAAPPQPAPAEPPRADTLDLAQLGAPCGERGLCIEPTTCVRYYGIAGPSGPQFSSCELPCAEPGSTCPSGASCVTIADGPGAVCRPDVPPDHPGRVIVK